MDNLAHANTLLRPNLPEGKSLVETQTLLDSMFWHQSIDFGDGLVAKSALGLKGTINFGDALLSNLELRGKSLLDIGAWNGAYSFEAKRRGTSRVVAADKYCWTHPFFKGRETFDLALQLNRLNVECQEIDIPLITLETVGSFNVVLFSGVFYHLINAVHLTRQISACAQDLLIVETHQDALESPRPAMVFYPGTTLAGDGTNWWGPNPQCMYELLTEFGFHEILYRDTYGYSHHARGIYHAFRDAESMEAMGVLSAAPPWISLSSPENRRDLFAPL